MPYTQFQSSAEKQGLRDVRRRIYWSEVCEDVVNRNGMPISRMVPTQLLGREDGNPDDNAFLVCGTESAEAAAEVVGT